MAARLYRDEAGVKRRRLLNPAFYRFWPELSKRLFERASRLSLSLSVTTNVHFLRRCHRVEIKLSHSFSHATALAAALTFADV